MIDLHLSSWLAVYLEGGESDERRREKERERERERERGKAT